VRQADFCLFLVLSACSCDGHNLSAFSALFGNFTILLKPNLWQGVYLPDHRYTYGTETPDFPFVFTKGNPNPNYAERTRKMPFKNIYLTYFANLEESTVTVESIKFLRYSFSMLSFGIKDYDYMLHSQTRENYSIPVDTWITKIAYSGYYHPLIDDEMEIPSKLTFVSCYTAFGSKSFRVSFHFRRTKS
jgi:hypothetical protein